MSELGIVLLALHLIGDFPLQSDWQAKNKLGGGKAHLIHTGIHFIIMLATLPILYGNQGVLIAMFVAGCHGLIDFKRWDPNEGLFDAYPIWSDQSLHVASIALAVVMFAP